MGEVFLAFDERLERRVAIKRVRWGPRRSPQLHERFRREARAAARLNHPAIVQVYDLIADGDGDAIVMEYVLGRPLSTLIGDPILTPALAVRLAREVAEGLAHAHAAGFVHRDLKAENVMMTGAGHAKILDFGIAKLVAGGDEESLTADGAVLGTYRSMSPEQAEGGEVDERSDLFSLGVLLYEMLSGQTPFHGDNPLAILKRVLAETPPPLYLALRQRLDGGQAPEEPELAKIEEIVQRSPRFLAAQITATDLGLALFNSTREPRYLERAQAFAQQAAALAPGDPRPLALQFRTAIERGDSREAEAAFARLAAALPGDPAVRLYHSSLAALRGHGDEALDDLRNATDHIPSWRNLYRLADLERRSGRLADARKHLELLHARAPRNLWGLEALAKLELDYGNPERAERLYRDLLLHAPKERALWTCLGLSQALAGRHETALASYRSALAIAPDHIAVLLNLADSELALGRRSEAEAHYRRVLDRLAVLESAASLRPDDRLVKAQCLAHLGRAEEAVAIVQQTLRQGPESPDLVYAAALVYALVGDRTSALLNAREALRLGEGASWFRLAPFQFIRDDPELRTQFSARALP